VQAEWRERNRERLREYDRMRLLGRDELSAEYARILRADACSYCGLRHTVHIDHVDAVAKDGGNEWENLTAACPACNGAKQDKRLLLYLLRR
jgi:5-methylcytosine-specific restriction endonuclease McrA